MYERSPINLIIYRPFVTKLIYKNHKGEVLLILSGIIYLVYFGRVYVLE